MRFGNLRMQASKIALTFHYISIILHTVISNRSRN